LEISLEGAEVQNCTTGISLEGAAKAEYVRRAVSGGAGDDGLIQRFGFLVWPDEPPTWKNVDRYPLTAAREAAWNSAAV